MRWIVALVLAVTAQTAAADDPDTALGPFRGSDDHAVSLAMHETSAPCRELAEAISDQPKLACGVVASLKVGGRLAEVYRSSLGGDANAVGVVLVIHHGKKLLASPILTAPYYYKLGAYSTVEGSEARLHAASGAAVLALTTSHVWYEQRTTPTQRVAWQAHAFLACRIVGGAGTCALAAVGSYADPCTATLAKDAVHVTCGATERDIALHD